MKKKALLIHADGFISEIGCSVMLAIQTRGFQVELRSGTLLDLNDFEKWLEKYDLVVLSGDFLKPLQLKEIRRLKFELFYAELLKNQEGDYWILNFKEHINDEELKNYQRKYFYFGGLNNLIDNIYISEHSEKPKEEE